MSKVISIDFRDSDNSQREQTLSNDSNSFVLISCSGANKQGTLDVEMEYSGDKDLIAYLLKSAESYFE